MKNYKIFGFLNYLLLFITQKFLKTSEISFSKL